MKEVFLVYSVQTTGCMKTKGENEANPTSLSPAYVVFTPKEAEHACKFEQSCGLVSWYIVIPVRGWSKDTMKKMRKRWESEYKYTLEEKK